MNESKLNGMHKTTFSLSDDLYEKMMKHLSSLYGESRGAMQVFIQDAIREKLKRDWMNA